MPDELRELVADCLSGEESAMMALVDRFRGPVFGVCLRMLGNREDAEDAAQETFVRALRHLRHWDQEREFAPWLFGTHGKVKVEKTELSRDPIRADSVIFSSDENETLHTEFQTTKKSDVALPLRFLDYYVGLKRKQPKRRVRQVLVVLRPSRSCRIAMKMNARRTATRW